MCATEAPLAVPGPTASLPPRTEGVAKLTGTARFTDDLVVPGAWHGATVRAGLPRARLLGLDRDPGFDWSAVVVVTAADIPGENVIAGLVDDQPALAHDEVRHAGEPIALVAAPTAALARAARVALRPRLEALAPDLDPEAATATCRTIDIVHGDPDAAFARADLVLTGVYRTGHQEHAYLEPQGMIAIPRDGGGATVHGSMQCPFSVHEAVVRALGVAHDEVRVIQEETGGGFGGKEDYPSVVAVHAALLARAAGRPVRLVYDRHEDIAATTKRHPSVIRHRTGVTRDGRLVAQDIEVVLEAGAYTTISPLVLSRAATHAGGPYRCADVRIRARAALTNTPPNGAFRGFGAPQALFAVETQLNRVAEVLGIAPDELRRRNALQEGDETPTGQVLRESVGALDVLEAAVAAAPVRDEPAAAADPEEGGSTAASAVPRRLAHGTGLALGWHGAGLGGSGERRLAGSGRVTLADDGSVRVFAGSTEMGQGARTVLAQVVAEALGIDPAEVEVVRADTAVVPDTGPTVASRSTMVSGGVLARAAAHLRADVEAATGEPFATSRRAFVARHGGVTVEEGFAGFPGLHWDDAAHRGDAFPAYSFACARATVDVDLDTGEVLVRGVTTAVDAGRIVHPVLAAGQVEGGTLQAVGWATTEAASMQDGVNRADRLSTYLVPTALDAPALDAVFAGRPTSLVPHGAKGLGELPMDVPAPAVVAAIHDATGAWITDLPATPERVLAALLAREESAR